MERCEHCGLWADSLLVDVRYALRQLGQFRDIQRAMDALQRIQCHLEHGPEDVADESLDRRASGLGF